MSLLKTHEKIYNGMKALQTQLHDQLTSMNVTLTGDETVLELIEKVSTISLITTTLTSTPSATSIHYGGTLTFTGTLTTSTGTVMSGYDVAIIEDGEILSTTTTDTTGAYSLSYTISSMTSPNLIVKFMGKANYKASSVTIPTITISKADTVITLTANPTTVSSGGSTTLTVTLKDEWGNNLNGETVSILNGSTELYSGIIDTNAYTTSYSPINTLTLTSKYETSNHYNTRTSTEVILTVNTLIPYTEYGASYRNLGGSVTYSESDQCYNLIKNSSMGMVGAYATNVTLNYGTQYTLDCQVKNSSINNAQAGFGVKVKDSESYSALIYLESITPKMGIRRCLNGTDDVVNGSANLTTNYKSVWLNYHIVLNGLSFQYSVSTTSGTVIYSGSTTLPSNFQTNLQPSIFAGWDNCTVQFKNLSIT